jgi:hypothetical protein
LRSIALAKWVVVAGLDDRFEPLKGRLLFARDMNRFLDAYSLACREYESQMRDYERQARYRLQRHIDRANLPDPEPPSPAPTVPSTP